MNNFAYDSWKTMSNAAEQVERAPKKDKRPELEVRVNNAPYRKEAVIGYIKFIVCGLIITAGLFVLMNGVIKCNELDIQIGEQTKVLEELKSEHVRLVSEVEKKQSREIIEAYAVNVLGMQPVQDYQKHTIHIERKDTLISMEGNDKGESLTDFISNMFS